MIDRLHQRGVGVILDWVPSHFPMDAHGLARFDGTHLYEHADPRQGYHPDWTSAIFNYGRREVRVVPHLERAVVARPLPRRRAAGRRRRLDAVPRLLAQTASGSPTRSAGGRTSRRSTSCASSTTPSHEEFPGRRHVRRGVDGVADGHRADAHGGLGFDYKWDMGWMHDTLQYLRRDPVHRRFHHDEITFRSVYALSERSYVLPLSHDEVVHGKGSLLGKMPATSGSASPTCACCTA